MINVRSISQLLPGGRDQLPKHDSPRFKYQRKQSIPSRNLQRNQRVVSQSLTRNLGEHTMEGMSQELRSKL